MRKSLAFFLVFCSLSMAILAQTRDTASLRGQVVDASEAAVPGATVEIKNTETGFSRRVTTDSSGTYAVTGLPLTGSYTITVAREGFADTEKRNIELRAGEAASIDFKLSVAAEKSTLDVAGTTAGIETESAQLETRLDLNKIDATPVLGRKLTTLPLLDSAVRPARGTGDLFINQTLFLINGSGRRQPTISIDNNSGDDSWGRQTVFTTIPYSSVQEFSVLTNAYSAEYGRTTGSAVNIVTKSGTNSFHGDLVGDWRPRGIQAKQPLAAARTKDELWQGSATLSGPIIANRTHFVVSSEYNRQRRDSIITSPLAPGLPYSGDFRQSLLLVRLDHEINSHNTMAMRVNFDRFKDTNPGDAVGGINLPSSARIFRRKTYSSQLAETANFSSSLINEARLQFQLASPITRFEPLSSSTQFVRAGVATEGESRFASLLNHQYQFADTISWIKRKHSLRMGTDVIYSSSGGIGQEFGGGFVLGQFRVNPASPNFRKPLSQLTIGDVNSYTQSFGNQNYNVGETLWALFLQDNYLVTPEFTLNLGLRYEQQTLTDDSNNVSPRVGFAYKIRGDRAPVFRGSYGIFYSEVRANLAAGYNINGPQGIFTFTAAPGQFGFPTSLAPLAILPAILPPRDITVRPGQRAFLSRFFDVSKLRFYPDALLNPYTQQWTFGLEDELLKSWIFSLDYVGQHTLKIERPVDLNAPSVFIRTAPGQLRSVAAADATRPIVPTANGFKRIVASVNQGAANYHGLQVKLNKRFSHHFSTLASYTWSHTINSVEFDTPQQDANDNNLLGRNEKATSLLDQRHRLVLSGWCDFPWRVSLGGLTSLSAGRPFNVTTGVDNNGDGSTSDRPVINGVVVARNFGQGTPVYDVSLFVEKTLKIAERWNMSLRAESFNLFNHANIVGRNGIYGNGATPVSTFGQPLGGINNVDPGREYQFQLRLRF